MAVAKPETREMVTTIPPDQFSNSDTMRAISKLDGRYDIAEHIPEGDQPGLNFTTALAAMNAIHLHGTREGWEPQDLIYANMATLVALKTAGTLNTQAAVEALRNGATGDIQSLIEKLLPQDKDLNWLERFIGKNLSLEHILAGGLIQKSRLDNLVGLAGILHDEHSMEKGLTQLLRFQTNILRDPARNEALLILLNKKDLGKGLMGNLPLPADAQAALVRFSPFSLGDMRLATKMFEVAEKASDQESETAIKKVENMLRAQRILLAGQDLGEMGGGIGGALVGGFVLFLAKTGEGVISSGGAAVGMLQHGLDTGLDNRRKHHSKVTILGPTHPSAHGPVIHPANEAEDEEDEGDDDFEEDGDEGDKSKVPPNPFTGRTTVPPSAYRVPQRPPGHDR